MVHRRESVGVSYNKTKKASTPCLRRFCRPIENALFMGFISSSRASADILGSSAAFAKDLAAAGLCGQKRSSALS